MIFSDNTSELNVFIHIPKTGGNSIQKALLDSGRSNEKYFLTLHQDGANRFELRSRYTLQKHSTARNYFKHRKFRSQKFYGVIRNPIERLVSLFFSPHRHMTLDLLSNTYVYPSDVCFDEEEFMRLVHVEKSSVDFLNVNSHFFPSVLRFPSKLTLLKYENLSQDCKKYLQLNRISLLNASPCSDKIKKVCSSKVVQNIVEASHHVRDIELFC